MQVSSFIGSPRCGCLAFSIGNFGYVGLGDAGWPMFDLYQYNPDSLTAIMELTGTNNFLSVYPLPATGMLNFKPKDASDEIVTITIQDMAGRQVARNNSGIISLTENRVAPGLYLYKVETRRNLYSGQFIVE